LSCAFGERRHEANVARAPNCANTSFITAKKFPLCKAARYRQYFSEREVSLSGYAADFVKFD
jgi:hypothetical protein